MMASSSWPRLATVLIAAFYLITAVSAVPMPNDVELVPTSGGTNPNKGTEASVLSAHGVTTMRPTNENEGSFPNPKVSEATQVASHPTIPLNTNRGASALAPSRGLAQNGDTIITPTGVDAKASAVGRQASGLPGRTRTASKSSSSNASVRRPAVRGAPPPSNGQLSIASARQAGQNGPTGWSRIGVPIRSAPRKVWNRETVTAPFASNTRASGPSTLRPSVPSNAVQGRTRATLSTGRTRQSSAPGRSVASSSTTVIDQRASRSVAPKLKQDQKAGRSILQQDSRVEGFKEQVRKGLTPSLLEYAKGKGILSGQEQKIARNLHELLNAALTTRSPDAAKIFGDVFVPHMESIARYDEVRELTQQSTALRAELNKAKAEMANAHSRAPRRPGASPYSVSGLFNKLKDVKKDHQKAFADREQFAKDLKKVLLEI